MADELERYREKARLMLILINKPPIEREPGGIGVVTQALLDAHREGAEAMRQHAIKALHLRGAASLNEAELLGLKLEPPQAGGSRGG